MFFLFKKHLFACLIQSKPSIYVLCNSFSVIVDVFEMLVCYICSRVVNPNPKILRYHIKSHELNGEGVTPYSCFQSECRNTYHHLSSLIRHIEKSHVAQIAPSALILRNLNCAAIAGADAAAERTPDEAFAEASLPSAKECREAMVAECCTFAAELRGSSGCSQRITNTALDRCNELCNITLDAIVSQMRNNLHADADGKVSALSVILYECKFFWKLIYQF